MASLSSEDRDRILSRIRTLTRLTDDAIRLPIINYRIGFDPLIGLIPGAGDTVGFVLSAYLLLEARRLGVPGNVLVRMLGNVVLDALVGAVPLVGDLFDFAFKANRRNMNLLERSLSAPPTNTR